ncbi:MAG: hypothetical protein IIY81_06425 [Lachnospiraceae bacterium]|nr:hypothetical protein [Lachnospiraceae bacterium]
MSKQARRLRAVRRTVYVAIAFSLFQVSGIFSMAGIGGLYVITETKTNAFYPKTYVDMDITEPNGNIYTVTENPQNSDKGTVTTTKTDVTDNNKNKSACVTINGANKKSVVVRARIIAEIYNQSGECVGTTNNYTLMQTYSTTNVAEADNWYYKDGIYYYTSVLHANERTENLFDSVTLTKLSEIPDGGEVKFHVIVDTLEVETETKKDTEKPTNASRENIEKCWTDTASINDLWKAWDK